MNAINLAVHDGRITATSRQIAEHFSKQHSHVLRAIANLDCSLEFRQSNFGSAHYLDEQGKPRQEYTLTRDGFVFLCMGFTGKEAAQWKERYIAAFNAMEARLSAPVPTFANRRWMIVVAPDGSETARPLDPEHFLSKIDELPKLLGDPEFRINNPQLINIILVCTSRLAAELAGKAHREYA